MHALQDGPRIFWLTTRDAARLGTWALYQPFPPHHKLHPQRYSEIGMGICEYITALEAQVLTDEWGFDVVTALFSGIENA